MAILWEVSERETGILVDIKPPDASDDIEATAADIMRWKGQRPCAQR